MHEIVKLSVNGAMREVRADPDAPLLYLLRNDLDFKGSRFGCGTGNCGACTVMVNGHAVQSCNTPLWSVSSALSASVQQIWTIEGLTQDPVGALVREAFLQERAAQCGYCINGIIVSTTALLKRVAKPGKEEILECLGRHLCRCGTHARILRAVQRAIRMIATRGQA